VSNSARPGGRYRAPRPPTTACPQRADPDSFELVEVPSRLGEHGSCILKNTRTERFILLTAEERFLWDRMNGSVSLQEMATAYVLTFGAFDFEIIPRLIKKLQAAQLLRCIRCPLRRP
jgi:hypothetical protein